MKHRKILVCGLPGAGKSTLSRLLARRLNGVHFNADDVRANINKDLGFSLTDRIEHAARMGWLCDRVVETGGYAIADFICPTERTRQAFFKDGDGVVVFVDRITSSRFADTDAIFERPLSQLRVTDEGTPEYWAERVAMMVRPVFDWKKPTALFVGRYQPFHDGHLKLIYIGIKEIGQACVAVRDTYGTDEKNPFDFEYVRSRIEHGLREWQGMFEVIRLPNITKIMYGRDVGYAIERVDLGAETENISASSIRKRMVAAT